MLNRLSLIAVVVLFTTTVFCQTSPPPKNIIFMIGDGMGVNYVSASAMVMENDSFKKFEQIGLVITCCADKLVTDSAAGATAFATGYRTNYRYVGVDPDEKPLQTIIEFVQKKGIATGVIATSSITNATPASFLSHAKRRNLEFEIAQQISKSGVDFAAAGGTDYFLPDHLEGKRADDLNLIDSLKSYGYSYYNNMNSFLSSETSGKTFVLDGRDGLPVAKDRDYNLGQITEKAINNLKNDKDGFFLMVEGSQIDWAGHDNLQNYAKDEIIDFNSAINAALRFAEADGNTLVIVTADHETGGMGIVNGSLEDKEVEMNFLHKMHTANMVGIFSYGPGSEYFGRIIDNHKVGRQLFQFYDNTITWNKKK